MVARRILRSLVRLGRHGRRREETLDEALGVDEAIKRSVGAGMGEDRQGGGERLCRQ